MFVVTPSYRHLLTVSLGGVNVLTAESNSTLPLKINLETCNSTDQTLPIKKLEYEFIANNKSLGNDFFVTKTSTNWRLYIMPAKK